MLGTRMAVWSDRLSEDEILAVSHYVRSLYQGEPR
jgi:mono/diheme cytochrome c family protein